MTGEEYRQRLAACRGTDAADRDAAYDRLTADVAAALDARNGSYPPVVEDDEDAPARGEEVTS